MPAQQMPVPPPVTLLSPLVLACPRITSQLQLLTKGTGSHGGDYLAASRHAFAAR